MRKNVAGQAIGCQMLTIADGSPFTGTVTVYITGDNGTQTIGSVASGVCTHKGRGDHSYAPAQAETNFDHVAFTFDGGATAVVATVQVYTTFPQTGDNFARLGAPAGASVSADMAAVKVDTAATLVDTGTTLDARIPAALISGRMDASVGAMAANVLTASAINADAITAAKLAADVTTELQAGLATPTNITAGTITTVTNLTNAPTAGDLTTTMKTSVTTAATAATPVAASVTGAVGSVTGLTASDVGAIKAKTDALPTDPADQSLIIAATDALSTLIGQRATPAQVNAEVVDALNVDTYAEPGQEAPGTTVSLARKINYLYKAFRNRFTQTATTYSLYGDDATTVHQKATVSDNATTFDRNEIGTGP